MKQCTKCKVLKSEEEFSKRSKTSEKRFNICKSCFRVYQNEHYQNNKSQYLDRLRKSKKKLYELVQGAKNKPCTDCGNKYHYCAMDFDHCKGVKEFDVSDMVAMGLSKKRILEEIEKCELVCAVCHRIRTFNRAAALIA